MRFLVNGACSATKSTLPGSLYSAAVTFTYCWKFRFIDFSNTMMRIRFEIDERKWKGRKNEMKCISLLFKTFLYLHAFRWYDLSEKNLIVMVLDEA